MANLGSVVASPCYRDGFFEGGFFEVAERKCGKPASSGRVKGYFHSANSVRPSLCGEVLGDLDNYFMGLFQARGQYGDPLGRSVVLSSLAEGSARVEIHTGTDDQVRSSLAARFP